MIYEHCLVVDYTIMPYEEFYWVRCKGLEYWRPRPTVALTAVNKSIGAEAAQVLFGKNVWRISSTTRLPFLQRKPGLSVWGLYATLFRKVKITFDEMDDSREDDMKFPRALVVNTPSSWAERPSPVSLQNNRMKQSRAVKLEIIQQMPNLLSIEVDVSYLRCSRRHRRQKGLENALCQLYDYLGSRSVRVMIFGIRGTLEQDFVRSLGFDRLETRLFGTKND